MDILRDQIWQFVGAVLAFVSIVVAFIIYFLQRNKKLISYTILMKNELLTTNEELRGRIRIYFGKTRIQNISLLVIEAINDGNGPILPSDFYENITFTFGARTNILSGEITNHHPETFRPVLKIKGGVASIEPILINRNDRFSIKFLLSQFKDEIKVGGRIIGGKVRMINYSVIPSSVFTTLLVSVILAWGVMIIAEIIPNLADTIYLLFGPIILFFVFMSFYLYSRFRKRVLSALNRNHES